MRFPMIMGGGVFAGRERYDYCIEATNALAGDGGFTDDPTSLYRRTLAVGSRMKARVSLTIDRVLANIFPSGTQKAEIMPMWERYLRVPADTTGTSEARRAVISEIYSDRAATKGIQIARKVADRIGGTVGGTVFYRFNTATGLDAIPASRLGIYQFAIEVPVAKIGTLAEWRRLKDLVDRLKPAHTNGAVTRTVAHGFLADDPLSLTDRDVVRI